MRRLAGENLAEVMAAGDADPDDAWAAARWDDRLDLRSDMLDLSSDRLDESSWALIFVLFDISLDETE